MFLHTSHQGKVTCFKGLGALEAKYSLNRGQCSLSWPSDLHLVHQMSSLECEVLYEFASRRMPRTDMSTRVYRCACFKLRLILNWREQADALIENLTESISHVAGG